MRGSFDGERFFDALDSERETRDLSWKDVAEQAKVSASSLTRMSQGKRPDVDTLAALLAWSGLEVEQFFTAELAINDAVSPLPRIYALLRSDDALSEEATTVMEEMIRSTYQRLKKPPSPE